MRHLTALVLALSLPFGCSTASDDASIAGSDAEEAAGPDAAEEAVGSDAGEAADGPDAPEEAPAAIDVSIVEFRFDPEAVTIQVGDTVLWTHDGDITHNVTATDGSFASENLGGGDTFRNVFDTAGTFEYRCTLHSQMIATVQVSDG